LRRNIFLVWIVIAGTTTASAWGDTDLQARCGRRNGGREQLLHGVAPGEIDAIARLANTSANPTPAIVSRVECRWL
jgi:hypothetical protein